MSRGKKGNGKSGVDSSGGESIDSVIINDDQWKCCLVFVAAKDSTVTPYMQALTSVVCNGNHKKFCGLDKEKLLQIAQSDAKLAGTSHSGGGERRSKQTTMQPSGANYIQVCESIAGLENEIPVTMMARLLKYVVLKRRTQDLADVEDKIREMNNDDSITSTKGKKSQQPSGRNSKAGKKGKNTPVCVAEPTVPLPVKQMTSMLKRGQDDHTKYLSHEQQNGPNCYIIVTGMSTSADIIKELVAVKLPVKVLMKLEVKLNKDDGHGNQVDDGTMEKFWMDIQETLHKSPSGSVLRDLACVDLLIDLSTPITTEYQSRPELECGQEILDQVIKKVYQVEKSLSHYHNYLSHLKLYDVSSSCDHHRQLQNTKRKRRRILSCAAISADVCDVLQAMISKVECTASQQLEYEIHPLKLAVQEEAAALCDMETSTAQQAARSHIQLTSCPIDACVKSTVNQSLYTRILNEIQGHSEEGLINDEKVLISQSDLYLYLILLSLEHACLSSASTPRNDNSLTPQHIFDCPLKVIAKTCSPTKPVDDFKKDISEYSSFELFSKAGVLKTLRIIQETHPYIELFYHALSHCTVLVAHTGYNGSRMHTYNQQACCHSNFGFYTFLKCVDETQRKSVTEGRYNDKGEKSDSTFDHHSEEDFVSNHSSMSQLCGYNVGDTLLHLQSSFFTFFTSDGVQVHVEKQGFIENSASVSVSVLTAEGHKISCVKSDCGLDELCSDSFRNNFQAVKGLDHMLMLAFLSNGLKVATCCNVLSRTDSFMHKNSKRESSLSSLSPQKTCESLNQQQTATSNSEPSLCTEAEKPNKEKEEDQVLAYPNEYQHLYAATSYGLGVHVYVALPPKPDLSVSNEGGKILVKQEHYKIMEMLPTEVNEVYRYYLQEGLLVYFMNDESLIIHCADGSIYRTATKNECYQYHAHQPMHPTPTDHFQFLEIRSQIMYISEIFRISSKQIWSLTLANGQCYLWKQTDASKQDNGELMKLIPIEGIPCSVTTDPVTKQVVTARADSVVFLHNSDIQVATFPNGTKFTSLIKGAITQVKVECLGYTTITFCMDTKRCIIDYQDGYQINCDSHGNYSICDNAMLNLSLSSQGKALYSPFSGGKYQFDFSGKEIIFDAVDSSNHVLKVNLHGEPATLTDCSPNIECHEAFRPRVFIINSNGTAYEAMKPTKMKEIVKLGKVGGGGTIIHNFSIPDTQYVSTLLMQPTVMNRVRNDDRELNGLLSWQKLSSGKTYTDRAIQISDVAYKYRQFITLKPLSDQNRDEIFKTCQESVNSGSPCLKQLWQNIIKAATYFLGNYSTKEFVSVENCQQGFNSICGASFTQRYEELQEILSSIRDSLVPVYFKSDDARAEQIHVLARDSDGLLISLTCSELHKQYPKKAQETVKPRRVTSCDNHISVANSLQQTTNAVDVPEQQQQLKEGYLQQTQMQLQPEKINFGVIYEGCTYVCHVQVHNVGVHSSRIKVKPPPKSSGIKVHYSPGLVAAGLTTSLSVELCGISNSCHCNGELFRTIKFCYDLEIYFQGGCLHLPIEASIHALET